MSATEELQRNFERQVREALADEITRQEMSPDELAEVLDMLPSGARALLERDRWSLRTALRVADGLGLSLEARVERNR